MTEHLGVKTPGVPVTSEPSTTYSCESSRAPKKSTKHLRQHLNSEQRAAMYKGLVDVMSNLHVRPPARKATEVSTVHTSPFSVTCRPTNRRAGQRRPQDPSSPSRRIRAIRPTHPGGVAEHVFAVEPGIAKKNTMQRTCR